MILAYGNGPLSMTVLANDHSQVEYLLRYHPTMLSERNTFRQTPLHLAVHCPTCLKLLIRSSDPGLLNQVDAYGSTVLDLAMRLSEERCWRSVPGKRRRKREGRKCHRCSCAECVVILLRSDCAVAVPPKVGFLGLMALASERSKFRYMRHLKDRRERLERLALESLPVLELKRLGLPGAAVLDFHAPEVTRLLRMRGVQVPVALVIETEEYRYASVYTTSCTLPYIRDAGRLFGLGFHDTGPCFTRVCGHGDPAYIHWLYDHGSNPSISLEAYPETVALSAAHLVFYDMGASIRGGRELSLSREQSLQSLGKALLPAELADSCQCMCSPRGCTPLIYFIKAFGHYDWELRRIRQVPAGKVSSSLGLLGSSLRVEDHVASMRFLTFEALGLRHTCCTGHTDKWLFGSDAKEYARGIWAEDAREIQEEEAALIARLEELMADFETELQARLANASSDAGHINPWKDFWSKRVAEESERLSGDKISDAERHGAEEVGVVWDNVQGCEKKPSPTDNPYDKETQAEYWFFELDKIVRGQWA